MAFETVVFDLDGTLVDSAPDLAEALNRVLAEKALPPVTPASVRGMVGEGAARMIARGFAAAGRPVGDPPPDALRRSFLAHYAECLADSTRPFPGAEEALRRLDAEGRRLAVCTNKPEDMSRALLETLGLARWFRAVLGGDSLPVRKPDPRHLIAAVRAAGGDPRDAAMVGDSLPDAEAAHGAGAAAVIVTFGYTRIPPRELPADAHIDGFDELLPALQSLARARKRRSGLRAQAGA